MDQTAFMIGVTVMSLASLAIYAKESKAPPSRHHTLLHAAVPFIAATAYLAMAFGIGTLVKADGSATYFARYADWTFTTPILLSSLVLLAFHERGKTGEVGGYPTSIIVLDVLMVETGLISSLAEAPLVKWVWFLYPLVFLIGPEGLKIIIDPASVWAILIMDVVAKVIYALYAASNLDKMLPVITRPYRRSLL